MEIKMAKCKFFSEADAITIMWDAGSFAGGRAPYAVCAQGTTYGIYDPETKTMSKPMRWEQRHITMFENTTDVTGRTVYQQLMAELHEISPATDGAAGALPTVAAARPGAPQPRGTLIKLLTQHYGFMHPSGVTQSFHCCHDSSIFNICLQHPTCIIQHLTHSTHSKFNIPFLTRAHSV